MWLICHSRGPATYTWLGLQLRVANGNGFGPTKTWSRDSSKYLRLPVHTAMSYNGSQEGTEIALTKNPKSGLDGRREKETRSRNDPKQRRLRLKGNGIATFKFDIHALSQSMYEYIL